MNVMSALENRGKKTASSGKNKAVQKNASPKTLREKQKEKPAVSEEEIRTKLAKKNEPVQKATVAKVETQSRMGMSDDWEAVHRKGEEAKRALAIKKQSEEDAKKNSAQQVAESEGEVPTERPSDVGKNDPTDPATVGKLKDLLSKGAFKFSDKEKKALSKILT